MHARHMTRCSWFPMHSEEEHEVPNNLIAWLTELTEQGLIHLDRDAVKFWFRLRESVSIDKKIRKESNEQSPR